ncbi:hypothetical protein Tco_1038575 [Tanacetum coccineum]
MDDHDSSLTKKKQKRKRTEEGPMDDHDSSLTKKKQKRKRTDRLKILSETCDSTITCKDDFIDIDELLGVMGQKADESINEAAAGSSGGLVRNDKK